MDVIVGHQNLDFDCISSMVAAEKLHPSANIYLQPTAEGNVLEYLNLHRHHFSFFRHKNFDGDSLETLIIVDTNRAERLGPFMEALEQAEEVIVYDHHPPGDSDIDADQYISDQVGALITLMVEQLREESMRISPIEATLFLLGIHQETGSLQFGNTTERDYEAGRYLLASGANLDVVQNFINRPLTDEQMELFHELLSQSRNLSINNVPVTIATATRDEYIPEISLLAHKIQDTENCNLLVVMVQLGDRIQLVFRNRHETVDVGTIASDFGGGGHARAASATLSGVTLEEAREAVEKTLQKRLKPGKQARDLMSYPVHSIRQNLPVEEAYKVMLRLGHQGMPVTNDEEKLVGIISRSDIDKAVQHELEHAPVKGFMSPEVVTVSPDTSLPQIKDRLMNEQIGRLPVIEHGELVGIVTRSDIIRSLHHDYSPRRELFQMTDPSLPGKKTETIAPRMKNVLISSWMKRLRQWGKLAEEIDESIFLVGGCVRDILLDQPTKDIDLVVEEDGIRFARALVEETGGKLSEHEKFRTAVVTLPGGDMVDIATARSEYYSHPAALPDVEIEHTSVLQDLRRRDFTINAMAVHLNPGHFGELLDLYGGRRDLEEGLVRILYATSFHDDPTRMFRAIRFAVRFDFSVEERTRFQMNQALQGKPFDPVSGDRLREELDLVFAEKKPWNVVEKLFDWEILQNLSDDFTCPVSMETWFERLEQYLQRFAVDNPTYPYYLCLLEPLPESSALFIARRLNFPGPQVRQLRKSRKFSEIEPELVEATEPSRIVQLLEEYDDDELLLARMAMASETVEESIRDYLERYRKIEPLVNGDDLKKWGVSPGPTMGKILDELFGYQLDFEIESKKKIKEYFENELKESIKPGVD